MGRFAGLDWAAVAPLPAGALSDLLPESIGPYIGLMMAGFAVGVLGHVFRLRWMVALGVIMVFLATLLFPLAVNLVDERPEVPGPVLPQ